MTSDDLFSASIFSQAWGISLRRVQIMCKEGSIPGAKKVKGVWMIPSSSSRPKDKRIKSGKYIFSFWSEKKIEDLKKYIEKRCLKTALKIGRLGLREVNPVELSEYIKKHPGKTFNRVLFSLVDQKGMTDVELYKKSGVDRRVFSKIRSNDEFVPSKDTIVRFCFGFSFDAGQAETLLNIAGYSLSPSSLKDVVTMYCLDKKIPYKEIEKALKKLESGGK